MTMNGAVEKHIIFPGRNQGIAINLEKMLALRQAQEITFLPAVGFLAVSS